MNSASCDAEELRVLRAKTDSLEDELANLKAEHLASDFERRRLERKLEVGNGELKDLTRKLGFSKEAEAMADKRYKRALEYNEEVEAEMVELKRRFHEERAELIGKLSDLREQLRGNEHLQISGNLKAENGGDLKEESPHRDDVSSHPSDHEQEEEVAEETSFGIFVKTITGKTLIMRIELFWTVEYLKSNIQDKVNIPVHNQKLLLAGKVLEDSQRLARYNIQKDCTIYLKYWTTPCLS